MSSLFTSEDSIFKLVIQNAQEAILIVDNSGKIVFSNDYAQNLLSYSEEEFHTINVFDISERIKANKEWQVFFDNTKKLPNGKIIETEIHDKNKNKIAVSAKEFYIEIKDNGYIIFFFHDIRDRVKEQQKIIRSKELLNNLLNNINEAIFFLDRDSKLIIECNNKAIQFFKAKSKHEIIGINGLNLLLKPFSVSQLNELKFKLDHLGFLKEEFEFKALDGSSFWGKMDISKMILSDEEIIIARLINLDTEKRTAINLKNTNNKYEALINNIQALIGTHDLDGKIITYNNAFIQSLNIPVEEISNTTLFDIVPETRHQELHEYLTKIRVEGAAKGVMEVLSPEKNSMYWAYNNFLYTDATSNETYVISSAIDITYRLKVEKDLIQAQKVAKASLKSREIFMATMSHEIRTPMNGILGMLSLLNKTELNGIQKNYINIIQNSANVLMVIINDILDYSKIESGKIEFEKIDFNLKDVLFNALQPLSIKAKEKGLQYTFECNIDSDTTINGDPYRLNQIVTNLVNNATKFTEKGGVKTVCDTSIKNDTLALHISVTDTGIGIPKNKLNEIFGEFTQAHSSHTRKFGGTGLGLSICKKLIELQGGEIKVNSKENKGSTFEFTIQYTLSKGKINKASEKSFDYKKLEDLKIIVADDNDVNLLFTRSLLEEKNIKVFEASNGKDAMSLLDDESIDLILMDIQMPILDGINATKKIRKSTKEYKNIPIIALTANALQGDLDHYLEIGMNDYISKPFKEVELFQKIAKALNITLPLVDVKTISTPKLVEAPKQVENTLYSLDYLKTVSNNNEAFIRKMIDSFIQKIPLDVDELKHNADIGNIPRVKQLAHKLKNPIALLKINNLLLDIKDLEFYDEKDGPIELKKRVIKFSSFITLVIDRLKKDYDSLFNK